MDELDENSGGQDQPARALVDRILHAFIEAVAAEEALGEIGARLDNTIIKARNFSEVALGEALFGASGS